MRPHLTVEQRQLARRLSARGLSLREIGRQVGCSHEVVRTVVRRESKRPVRLDSWRPGPGRLTLADREEISLGLRAGESFTAIAGRLGKAVSTVSREVAANGGRTDYRAWRAHQRARTQARRPKPFKLCGARLAAQVTFWLREWWSPQQISHRLRIEFPDDPMMRVSHETIYQSLFVQGRGELRRELARCLRTGRVKRRSRRVGENTGQLRDMVMISERPAEVDDRAVPGHWEGDLLMGTDNRTAVGTLVERTSRYLLLLHLHVVVTGEPGTRKRVRPVRREATRKRTSTTLAPRRVAHPTQTLERELLDTVDVWPDINTVQAAVDAFRQEYNTDRPHQSLDMAFPADRFIPRPADERLPLRLPPTIATAVPAQFPAPAPRPPAPQESLPEPVLVSANGVDPVNLAVEVDRVVPASGNLQVCGQQFWLGPDRASTTITLWADTTVVHLIANEVRLKTVPSRLTIAHLTQLLADGGRPAGPAPIPHRSRQEGTAVEVDRLISPIGVIGLAGRQHPVGYHFAGRRVTVRLDGGLLQLVDQGVLLRSLPNPLSPTEQTRLRDARPAGPAPQPAPEPIRVQRRVSRRGTLVVARQRIHIGIRHAGRTLDVEEADNTWRVYDGNLLLAEVPRTTTSTIARFKVRKPEPPRQRRR